MHTSQSVAFVTTALVLITSFLSSGPVAAQPRPELVEQLEVWLDQHSDLPRASEAPAIFLKDPPELEDERTTSRVAVGERTRGLYNKSDRTITLFRPWTATNTEDVSVLLHELVHHRQATANRGCRARWEYQAYKLQEKWMNAREVSLDVNWTVIGLTTNCKLQNVHPD
ncbi:DUF6647 family protein [Lutimaribacter saemankumensis]|uniref:DUF6647 domain-containing protein n=1 Tax=Lutimaribacter saemankumensis TaxID=490829 RepID=A0A1G8SFI0_9RHOB|nr:DUF6647 family protein [Lutimaribacter saemankumensis]SDJ28016.1 hypothetical protein SAMN05421850_11161 [Lutimaribacter saemankumensis]